MVLQPGRHEEPVREPVQEGHGDGLDLFASPQRHGAALGAAAHRAGVVQGRPASGTSGQDEALERLQFGLESIDVGFQRIELYSKLPHPPVGQISVACQSNSPHT